MISKLCLRVIAVSAAMLLGACGGSSSGGNAEKTGAAGEAAEGLPGFLFETELGDIRVLIYPKAAPETVERYREYVDTDYFAGRSFGRVIPGFVIQVTDRLLGQTEDNRRVFLEVHPHYHFSAGALGIARGSSPASGGPEFFIMDFASGHLNDDYTVFGQVIEGMDVVRQIARVAAIDWRDTTTLDPVLFDRYAIDPVEITNTEHIVIDLPPELAARYPLQTAERLRTDCCAHNLEWPRSIAAGAETDFTWYVTIFDGESTPPDGASVTVRTPDGSEIAVTPDDTTAGIYRFNWTPPSRGEHTLTLLDDGAEVGALVVKL